MGTLHLQSGSASIADATPIDFTFADFGSQNPAIGRFTSWADMMGALATLEVGSAPTVTVALTGGPFTVPIAGMPVTGWDFRGGKLSSFFRASGFVTLDCPAGVKLDNLFAIDNGLVLSIAPPLGTGVLEYTALAASDPRVFEVGDGSYVRPGGAGALVRSKGDQPGGTLHVLIANSSAFDLADPPIVYVGPLLFLSNDGGEEDDGAVAVQSGTSFGGLPNGWLENNNAAGTLGRIYNLSANTNTLDLPTWIPLATVASVFVYATDHVDDTSHGARAGGALHAIATALIAGFMSALDFVKLAALPASSIVTLGADVVNANAVANTLADVTGLAFPVTAGVRYYFRFVIMFTTAAAATGSRWSINGPALTMLLCRSTYTLAATTITTNEGLTAYNLPAASNASALVAGSMAIVEGFVTPSASGSVIARFASEVALSAITAKAGSTVEFYPVP